MVHRDNLIPLVPLLDCSRAIEHGMHHPLMACILHDTVRHPSDPAAWDLSTHVLQAWLADSPEPSAHIIEYIKVRPHASCLTKGITDLFSLMMRSLAHESASPLPHAVLTVCSPHRQRGHSRLRCGRKLFGLR